MSRRILGLDIHQDAVAAVLMSNSLKGNIVESHVFIPFSQVENGQDPLEAALKAVFDSVGSEDAECMLAVPAELISYRNLQLPFKEVKKIRQILPFELEPTMPVPVDDLLTDFQVIPLDDPSKQTHILAAAVEISKIDGYLRHLESYQIAPHLVAIGGNHAALCASHYSDPEAHSLLIDIDSHKCSVFAVVRAQICFVRSFQLGAAVRQNADALGHTIQRTLAASETLLDTSFDPTQVFLTGHAVDTGVDQDALSQVLNLPVRLLDLGESARLQFSSSAKGEWAPTRLNNALALALAEIEGLSALNFGRKQFAAQKHWKAHKKEIIRVGILAAVALVLGLTNLFYGYHTLSSQIDKLNQQMMSIFKSTFPEIKQVRDPLNRMRSKIKEIKQQSSGSDESAPKARAIDILNDISTLIPDSVEVELNQLVISPDHVLLSGETPTFNLVDDIKSALEKGDLFKSVTISSANADKTGKKVNFKIKIEFEKTG